MNKIKLLLVEDRDIIRDCIRLLLNRSNEVEIVAEATDGLEALYYAQNIEYDVILMDYCMPGMNGHDALKYILEINNEAKVIMFSFLNNPFEIRELLDLGACGYILKDSEINVYEDAIKTVHQGGKYLCESTKQLLISLSMAS